MLMLQGNDESWETRESIIAENLPRRKKQFNFNKRGSQTDMHINVPTLLLLLFLIFSNNCHIFVVFWFWTRNLLITE